MALLSRKHRRYSDRLHDAGNPLHCARDPNTQDPLGRSPKSDSNGFWSLSLGNYRTAPVHYCGEYIELQRLHVGQFGFSNSVVLPFPTALNERGSKNEKIAQSCKLRFN